jgi:hypothetical protein
MIKNRLDQAKKVAEKTMMMDKLALFDSQQ